MERGKETAEKSRAVVWSETRFMTHIGDSASSKMDVVTQQRGQKPPFRKEGESSQEFGFRVAEKGRQEKADDGKNER